MKIKFKINTTVYLDALAQIRELELVIQELEVELVASQKRATSAENNISGLDAQLAESRRKIQDV